MTNPNIPWYIFSFVGIVCFQLIFILYQYFIYRRLEFVYYLLYIICVSSYHVFLSTTSFNPFYFTITPESNFIIDRGIAMLCYFFYFKFGEHFCNMDALYTNATKILRYFQKALLVVAIIDIVTSIIAQRYFISETLLFGFTIVFTVYSFLLVMFLVKQKDILANILVIGTLALLIFIVFSTLYMKVTPGLRRQDTIQYSYIGVVLEFLFLNFGLILKSKFTQEKVMNSSLISQQELYKERDRITADLHDEIGGGISTIRILSDIHRNVNDIDTHKKFAEKIADVSEDLSKKMQTLIWALKSENDELGSLISYIEVYAKSIFEHTQIRYTFQENILIPKTFILGNILRKNLFLCVKEALTNILKHADASEVQLKIEINKNRACVITIVDNGKGIAEAETFGNGIRNIKKRMEEVGGTLAIESRQGETKLKLSSTLA